MYKNKLYIISNSVHIVHRSKTEKVAPESDFPCNRLSLRSRSGLVDPI